MERTQKRSDNELSTVAVEAVVIVTAVAMALLTTHWTQSMARVLEYKFPLGFTAVVLGISTVALSLIVYYLYPS